MNQTLESLLDAGQQFDPAYLPAMNADHLPMTLVAMHYLGASDDALTGYQLRYRERLRPVVEGPILSSISAGRGEADGFGELRKLLLAELDKTSIAEVTTRHLPDLLPSMAAGAFHPLIRLGFALTSGHKGEVASALAYWMTSRFRPALAPTVTKRSLFEQLMQLPNVHVEATRFGDGLKGLVDQQCYPAPVEVSVESCAALSLDIYLGTRNFFALHLVTATQAARVCIPYAGESLVARALSAAIQAAYLVLASPDFSVPQAIPGQLDEEHNIKYFYACAREYECYRDPRYAEEMLGFIEAGLVPAWVQMPAEINL